MHRSKRRSSARAASRLRCRTPACRASSSPSRAAISSTASTTSIGTTTRSRARTCPTIHGADRVQQQPDSRAQQRDRQATTTRHPGRRSDQEGTRSGVFGTYREQKNAVAQPNFQFDKTFDTKLWNAVGKGTYQMNQKNKFIGYYQWGQKEQPNRLPFATYTYNDPSGPNAQDSGSWVYKGEWNGTLSDKMYLEARYGDFGYYFPLLTNSRHRLNPTTSGATPARRAARRPAAVAAGSRPQAVTSAATYFLDTTKGSHTFKFGGETAGGDRVGRLRAAVRRQHRTPTTPTASQPDRDFTCQRPRRSAGSARARRRPDGIVGARKSFALVRQRYVGLGRSRSTRAALRPLLAARCRSRSSCRSAWARRPWPPKTFAENGSLHAGTRSPRASARRTT